MSVLDTVEGIREWFERVRALDPGDLMGTRSGTLAGMLGVLFDEIERLELELKTGKTSPGGVETVPLGKRVRSHVDRTMLNPVTQGPDLL